MKLILRADLADLGKRGDLVEVADGYARNYLIPQHLAMPSTAGAAAQADAMRRGRDQRDAAAREEAEDMAKKLVTAAITIPAKAGDSGKLFGSITNADVAEAIEEQTGFSIDRKHISIEDQHLRTLGAHTVTVQPHNDVAFPVNVEVVAA
ncbi:MULTISPECIES: 50S ribosomal protein L9 [Candidatus Microthrix]|uniref:Large ribosomal subunit protein bL9 n=1 Tax=Candidatus Neomicrothrix parvicella RN1 TaxID=1229780 RepID=R4YWD7_9ACTN|nr:MULTISPECIES: 50S ribosomal protein L9 [Microthrix]NLH68200.1 50S ribosomal protein L9 [Candidatus Microthrix parvicella]MBK6503982.1 50S ribosomal protein L9 [Candidatus Microthrix sp.]MBK7019310.1 50S ribosomal protein L9 [Candidatus Microthrix sp.]MBK7320932.1 50S ribosomal protein L9 [Candidatus Microthrix sp.]MBL0204280.1 50S ribosomal protein L9 [Candidatus Microthrix sp.]